MSTPPPYGQQPRQPGYGQQVPPPPTPDAPRPPAPTPAPAPAQSGYGTAGSPAYAGATQHTPAQQPSHQHQGQQQSYPGQQASHQAPHQQPGYGSQGGQPGTSRRRGRTTTVVVTALVTAAVSVTATLLATGTLTGPSVLEQDALQDGVTAVLTDEFDLSDVDDVSCPEGIEAVTGAEFECSFSSGGEDLSVPVEVLNDAGQYRVGGPLDEQG